MVYRILAISTFAIKPAASADAIVPYQLLARDCSKAYLPKGTDILSSIHCPCPHGEKYGVGHQSKENPRTGEEVRNFLQRASE